MKSFVYGVLAMAVLSVCLFTSPADAESSPGLPAPTSDVESSFPAQKHFSP
jgi:hypothetical protein